MCTLLTQLPFEIHCHSKGQAVSDSVTLPVKTYYLYDFSLKVFHYSKYPLLRLRPQCVNVTHVAVLTNLSLTLTLTLTLFSHEHVEYKALPQIHPFDNIQPARFLTTNLSS